MKQVVVMAAGLGSRLKELTKETPKPLLKVNGKPMLETNIEYMFLTSYPFVIKSSKRFVPIKPDAPVNKILSFIFNHLFLINRMNYYPIFLSVFS